MDSLTQIVLGASVSEACLGKKLGNKAIVWGAIAGTIPDLDVFLKYFYDPITTNELHRGFSHSLIFFILVSPLLAWLAMRIHKRRTDISFKAWTWMFFLVTFTHALLDTHTTWGTQLFWPIEYRVTYKNIFVADPLYTIPFMVFLIMAMFRKKTDPKRRKYNKLALIVSTAYMALTFAFKGIGYYQFSSALEEQGIEYIEMDTKPTPLNSLLWNAHVETKDGFLVGYYSLLDGKEIKFQKEISKNHHLIKPYENQESIKQLKRIATNWFFIEKVSERQLIFNDMRFGQFGFEEGDPFLWRYEINIDDKGKVKVKRLNFSPKGKMGNMFGDLWTRIIGN